MRIVTSLVRLTRPYSSLLAFLSILIPAFTHTRNIALSVERAMPLLFVSICTFLSNDLDDIDKDRTNHPERPLPSGEVSPTVVVVVYYLSLALALLTTRHFVPLNASVLYYTLLVLCISYHYVVEYLPSAKAPYVAAASSIPLFIVATSFSTGNSLFAVAIALFAFMLGREICKDLLDREGDPPSLVHRIPEAKMAKFAFGAQAVALALLTPLVIKQYHFVVFSTMTVMLVMSHVLWFRANRRVTSTAMMKVIVFLGLAFLL